MVRVAYRIVSSYKDIRGIVKGLSIYGSQNLPPDIEATFIRYGIRTRITYAPVKVEKVKM